MRRKMKNYLRELAFVLVLFGLLVYYMLPKFLAAQNINDEAHFPDAEFRSVVENFMNVEPGGRFSALEAERKTGMFRLYADDVRGLHYFRSITEFRCHQRKITKLNLSAITNLRDIQIIDVPLEELILPRSEQLDTIYLRNIKLCQLDVSGCPNLYHFECSNALLSSIDVTHNPTLFDLRVDGNQIQEIDLTNNPALNTLECSSNQLPELDLSRNVELRHVWCAGNPLMQFDLSKLTHLSSVAIDLTQMELVDRTQKRPSLHVILRTSSVHP